MYVGKWVALGVLLLALCGSGAAQHSYTDDDDDFGILDEHDDEAFVEDEVEAHTEAPAPAEPSEDPAEEAIDDYDTETSHLTDSEEFEGFSPDEAEAWRGEAGGGEPKLKVAEVPPHLRSSWHAYPLEALLLAGLALYAANYVYGRAANQRKAAKWFAATRPILAQNFALVGDDGRAALLAQEAGEGSPAPLAPQRPAKPTYDILRESDSLYSIYCSGRLHVTSMVVELRLLKRQDLLSVGLGLVRAGADEAVVRLQLEAAEAGVLCVAARRHAKRAREMTDITTYAGGERKGFLPVKQYGELASKFSVWAELPEAAQALLSSPRLLAVLPKYLHALNYLHISDQYTGVPLPDADAAAPRPAGQKVLLLSVALTEDAECLRQTLLMALALADRLATFRLSKESKAKAARHRARTAEAQVRSAHLARSERAMEKREERLREERERMMEIEDPERQRRWEEKENKRLARKRVPKVKQMRVN